MLKTIRAGPNGNAEEAYIDVRRVITEIEKLLLDIDTQICEGAYIRCGAKWKCESEQPTKIFMQQEKWRGQQRYLGILEVDGDEPGSTRLVTNQPEIETEINNFYKELYRERATQSTDTDLQGFMGDIGYESFHNIAKKNVSTLRGLGTPNSELNRRQRGRKAPGAG